MYSLLTLKYSKMENQSLEKKANPQIPQTSIVEGLHKNVYSAITSAIADIQSFEKETGVNLGSIFTQHLKNAGKVLAPALKIFARRNNDQDPYLAIEQNALSQMQNNQLAKDAEIDEWASLADAHDQIRCQVNSLGKEANELQQILTPKKAGRSKKDEGLNEQPANAAELQADRKSVV